MLTNKKKNDNIVYIISRDGAVWSARLAHNQEVVGSNPTPATKKLFQKITFQKWKVIFIYKNKNRYKICNDFLYNFW